MSKSSTASAPKTPQLLRKSAWEKGPQTSSTAPTPRSQTQAPNTNGPASPTHSRRPRTLGQGVSFQCGIAGTQSPPAVTKTGSSVTFGSISDNAALIQAPPASSASPVPAATVKSSGSLSTNSVDLEALKISAVAPAPAPLPSSPARKAQPIRIETPEAKKNRLAEEEKAKARKEGEEREKQEAEAKEKLKLEEEARKRAEEDGRKKNGEEEQTRKEVEEKVQTEKEPVRKKKQKKRVLTGKEKRMPKNEQLLKEEGCSRHEEERVVIQAEEKADANQQSADSDAQERSKDRVSDTRDSLRTDTGVIDNASPTPRPGPLDLSSAMNKPIAPSLPGSALSAARRIQDIGSIRYPEGIRRPKIELNVYAQMGKFCYDRDFLLQFMDVCREKPDSLPPLDAIGLQPVEPDFGLGISGINKSTNPFSMGTFATQGGKMNNNERFQMSSGRSASIGGPPGLPFGRPVPMSQSSSQGGPGAPSGSNRTRSQRGGKKISKPSTPPNMENVTTKGDKMNSDGFSRPAINRSSNHRGPKAEEAEEHANSEAEAKEKLALEETWAEPDERQQTEEDEEVRTRNEVTTTLSDARCRLSTDSTEQAFYTLGTVLDLALANAAAARLQKKVLELKAHLRNFQDAKGRKEWGTARVALDKCCQVIDDEGVDAPNQLRLWRVELELAQGNWEAARSDADFAALAEPHSPDALALRALVLFLTDHMTHALHQLDSALRIDPGHETAQKLRERVEEVKRLQAEGDVALKSDEWKEATEKYGQALDRIGENEEEGKGGPIRAILLSKRVTPLLKLRRYEDAQKDMEASRQIIQSLT